MASWGPPTNTTFDSADHMLAMTLAAQNGDQLLDPVARFHRTVETGWNPPDSTTVSLYLGHLDAIAARGQSSVAWASINVALEAATSRGYIGLVQAILNVPNWQLCIKSRAVDLAARSRKYTELIPLLLSDARFASEQTWSPVAKALVETAHELYREGRPKKALHLLLTSPSFPPRLVWQHALALAMSAVVEPDMRDWVPPKIFDMPVPDDDFMDTAQGWQFERARSNRTTRRSEQPHSSWTAVPPRLLLPPACASLLVDLPHDLHLRLHDMLDLPTLRSVRLTCRALQHFPTDRFALRRMEYELRKSCSSTTQPDYDSGHLQSVVESLGYGGPSAMDYRTLVEAVRHLDVRLALMFLYPDKDDIAKGYDLRRASPHPESVDYVVSWALCVLLKTLKARTRQHDSLSLVEMEAGGIILEALLMHPMLYEDAWSFTVFYIDECRLVLNAAATSAPASDSAADLESHFAAARSRISSYHSSLADPATATPNLLIHLIRTGHLLDWLPLTLLADLNTPNPSLANLRSITRVFVLLCTISYVPSTFSTLMHTFSSPLATPTKRILLSTLYQRPDPELYLSHVLSALAPVPDEILRAPIAERAKRVGNEDVMRQLLPHLNTSDVYTLLPSDAYMHQYPPVVKMNALVLTHLLQRVGDTQTQNWEADELRSAGKVKEVDWVAIAKLVHLIRAWLQEMEGEGDQAAGERLRQLVAACEAIPLPQVQQAVVQKSSKGCLVQ